jgi:hypothetical protein
MPTLYTAAALAVGALYCVWRARAEAVLRRRRELCRRVASLLWAAAAIDAGGAARQGSDDYGYDEE